MAKNNANKGRRLSNKNIEHVEDCDCDDCCDSGESIDDYETYKRSLDKAGIPQALLYAVMQALGKLKVSPDDVFDVVDWKQVGVIRQEAEIWWEKYLIGDRLRRKALQEIERKETILKNALSKLTDEEKSILGISIKQKALPKKDLNEDIEEEEDEDDSLFLEP